jgi:signal transduction histidine kinase
MLESGPRGRAAAEAAPGARAGADLRFLAEAGEQLATLRDEQATLATLARLVVPRAADYCIVDLIDPHGQLERAAARHVDPAKEPLLRRLRRYPPGPARSHPTVAALQSGRPFLAPTLTDADLTAAAQDDEHLAILRALRPTSAIVVPLPGRERALGALVLARVESRRYDAADLALAEELARRAALAIDNARLHRAEQQARAAAEAAARRARFQAEASRILAGSLDHGASLPRVARLAVPTLADACVVDLPDEQQVLRREAFYCDPTLGALMEEMNRRYPYKANPSHPIVSMLATGKALLFTDFGEQVAQHLARDAAHLDLLRRAAFCSAMFVPLKARGQTIGGLRFYTTAASGRRFAPEDLALAEELAHLCAQTIDNARLHRAEQRARAAAETARQQATFLAEAGAVLASSLDYQTTLAAIGQLAVPTVADLCIVDLLDEHGEVRRVAATHINPERKAIVDEIHRRNPYTRNPNHPVMRAFAGAAPIFIPDLSDDLLRRSIAQDGEHLELERRAGWISALLLPLVARGQTFGVLRLYTTVDSGRSFGPEDQAPAEELARRCAQAIDHARLYEAERQARTQAEAAIESARQSEQERALAAQHERQRLARDLHDAVTQTLFSASLIADVLPRIWERRPDEGRRRLAELRELTRGALAEMRTLLLELRPAALVEADLGEVVRQLGEAVTGRWRIPVAVTVTGHGQPPPEVRLALYRIAQEALSNMAKHSGASRAIVTLAHASTAASLRVEDDGRGFEPEGAPSGHLGLGIMRERAEAVGACLTIDSRPGAGTVVAASWTATGEGEP